MKKVWIIIAIVVVAAGAFFFYQQSQAKKAAALTKYQTEQIEKGTITATIGATGTVHAVQSAVLIWQTNGTVSTVNFKVGDLVKPDDELAALSSTSLSQGIILAQADLVNAQKALDDLKVSTLQASQAAVNLNNAKNDYEDRLQERQTLNSKITYNKLKMTPFGPRLKEEKRDPTLKEIEEADAKLALAEAKLSDAQREYDRLKDGPDPKDIAAAESRVAAAQATINLARLIAPFNGTITDVNVLPGDVVTAGQNAFRIDDLSHLLVDVEVSEVDINQVKEGQKAVVSFDSITTKEYQGVVTEVARVGTSVNGVVNFWVTVEIADADDQVLPLMTAAVNIVTSELNDVVLVPNRSVRVVDGKRTVFVMKDNVPTAVVVEVGSTNGVFSEYKSGDLNVGDTVIVNPPAELVSSGPGGPFMMRR